MLRSMQKFVSFNPSFGGKNISFMNVLYKSLYNFFKKPIHEKNNNKNEKYMQEK